MSPRRRFYREVSVAGLDSGETAQKAGNTCRVLLDGKPIRTPEGSVLTLPNRDLAEAVAEEWRSQVDILRPESMLLTKLANTACERVGPKRTECVAQIMGFARSELLCYRAASPDSLVERQAATWDPLLAWAQDRYGVSLRVGTGIHFIEQPAEAFERLETVIARHGDFVLTGLLGAATLLGSSIVALALTEGRLDADEAHATANLDDLYQAERWGQDEAQARRLSGRSAELKEITRFLRLAMPLG